MSDENVTEARAVEALGALAHEHRLAIFRLLMWRGPSGLPAGEIAVLAGLSPSNLSFHIAQLGRAGLLRSWRVKRSIHYAVDIDGTRQLLSFLTEECCDGNPEICGGLLTAADFPAAPAKGARSIERPFDVLFLCRANSARSQMAESILNRLGAGRFRAWSAGSMPAGAVHSHTLDLLVNQDFPTAGLRSKNWSEFADGAGPGLDFVFTVCDAITGEACPTWPGQPMSAHWGVPDPASVDGAEAVKRVAFADAFRMLHTRIDIFVNLPMASLDKLSLQKRLDEIGTLVPTPAAEIMPTRSSERV